MTLNDVQTPTRKDAVLVLDEHTNFVSYISPPYKLLIGHHGGGEFNQEPLNNHNFYNDPSILQIFEEYIQRCIDYYFMTRDVSFFWHEVLHKMLETFISKVQFGGKKNFDFFSAGYKVLGDRNGVLNNTKIDLSLIPVSLYNGII